MVAYLDDWLTFAEELPVPQILQERQTLGLTINFATSVLQPTRRLTYLGLDIDLPNQRIQATTLCIQHSLQLIALLPQASQQDLRRITGYVTWLAWAMNWPMFSATLLLQRDPYWVKWLFRNGLLQQPRKLSPPLRSVLVYTDATPSSIGIYWPGPSERSMYRQYEDQRPNAFAETAAALVGLIHTANNCTQPTTTTLATDSAVVFYIRVTGKGATLRQHRLLQELYITFFSIKNKRGHRLVVRWVPSDASLADPVLRGVLAI
jgi:hypothetical protein